MKQSEIQTKLDLIPENLEKLKMLRSKSYEEFISDFRNVDSALIVFKHQFKLSWI